MLGVSFVAGSFVLADSLRATFDNLFSELNENVDLEVRATLTVDNVQALPRPGPGIARRRRRRRSRASPSSSRRSTASHSCSTRTATRSQTQGAPALGVSWTGPSGLSGVVLKDGAATGRAR